MQGPQARRRLETVAPEAAAVGRFRVAQFTWRGVPCTVAGTGYTGEDGVEVAVPAEAAADLWRAVLGAGVAPAGLGARDTLRLEAALPLHGHELGPGITPLQANLGWVVSWKKPTFRGREALEAERERGVARLLRGITTDGRRPPRAECPVRIDGARRRARPPAATSRPFWATASRWPSCRRTSRRAPRWRSMSVAPRSLALW